MNTSDDSVIDYLKLFTFLTLAEIGEIGKTFNENPGARGAQKKLAYEVTKFVHGGEVAEAIERVSASLFGEVALSDLSDTEIGILKENAPLTQTASGTTIVDILVEAGLATSKREARTFIEGGAVQVNGVRVEDVEGALTVEKNGELVLLKRGKKNVGLVEVG